MTPHSRVPYHGPVVTGSQDQDNFVRDLITILGGSGGVPAVTETPVTPRPPSESLSGTAPVVPLETIKLWCHIEADQTEEDSMLLMLEMAARLHTQNKLRAADPLTASCGENIKTAILGLIAYWYRNREAIATGETTVMTPLFYDALLSAERNYPSGCY